VIFPGGPLWREQRKFMARALRDLGAAGRATGVDQHALAEADMCVERLLAAAADAKDHAVEMQEVQNMSIEVRTKLSKEYLITHSLNK